ncbi:hypothetical protein U9R71_13755 [Bacillus toyonensis]|uniref:hypothetical protein n=1 Tax=Bacillus toyonensis TaxID=155322 RepID=UPI001443C52B|nr:hypothetical protein [Bacillus toyonensis]MBH0356879.1 hypothetical protein [Bacillus toyonensis biovar Thuringiensis]NKW97293.1 hypothetical protein [Bacillus toyonensis]
MCVQTATIVFCLDSGSYGPGATSIDVDLNAPEGTSGFERIYTTMLEYWNGSHWEAVSQKSGSFKYSVTNVFPIPRLSAGKTYSFRVRVNYTYRGTAYSETHSAVTVRR